LGSIPICVLLAGVVLQWLLARVLSSCGKGWLAFATGLAALGAVLAIWPTALAGESLDFRLFTWDGPIAMVYHIDGLSQLFALMATGIGAAVLLYSVGYMAKDRAPTRFYVLILIFIAGLVNLVYSANLFLMYLSWEIIGLCSFMLVGFWYQQREAAVGARKVLVMTHIAGYGLLAAIILLYTGTGSTLWTDPRVAASFSTGLFILVLVAATAKSVQFPLHTWIPDAMAAPTPVSALLHAACYVKAGVYLIARLYSLGMWPTSWMTTLTWLGTITILVGVLFAMIQTDLKRLLAFHTVSQIGYMMLGLGLGTPLGIAAALLHCLNHGLFKGGLFLCAGAVQQATGTRDMDRLGGLVRHMPRTTLMWLILAGSISGVPFLSGFVSKWLIYVAAINVGQPVPALAAWVASIFTAFSFLKATSAVFFGNERPETANSREAPRTMLAGIAILAVGSVVLGVAPQIAINYAINPLLTSLHMASIINVSWLGLTAAGNNWFATGGLVISMVAIGAGFAIYRLSRPRPVLAISNDNSNTSASTFTGGEPLIGSERLSASEFSLSLHERLAFFYKWADTDLYYRGIWHGLLAISHWLGKLSRWLENKVIPVTLGLIVLLVLVLGLTTRASSNPVTYSDISNLWQLIPCIFIALLALSMTASAVKRTRMLLPFLIGSGLLVIIGLVISQSMIRLLFLEAAAFVAVMLVWQATKTRAVAYVYLLVELISAVVIISGMLVLQTASPLLVVILLMTGFVLRLALIPLYLYLPMVSETTPAVVIGLVTAIIDVSAFGELLMLGQSAPWVLADTTPWIVIALLSALGGGMLMLAQRDLKRLLAFSSIQSMGYLFLGVVIGGTLGQTGALFGAMVDALAMALLFSSLAQIEVEGQPTLDMRGLTARYPLAGAGFLIGMLTILGIPVTGGYLSHWRVFSAAADVSPAILSAVLTANALAVLAFARVIKQCWWGSGEKTNQKTPVIQNIALIFLSVTILAMGIWPGLLNIKL